jgi:hypothetical protein
MPTRHNAVFLQSLSVAGHRPDYLFFAEAIPMGSVDITSLFEFANNSIHPTSASDNPVEHSLPPR